MFGKNDLIHNPIYLMGMNGVVETMLLMLLRVKRCQRPRIRTVQYRVEIPVNLLFRRTSLHRSHLLTIPSHLVSIPNLLFRRTGFRSPLVSIPWYDNFSVKVNMSICHLIVVCGSATFVISYIQNVKAHQLLRVRSKPTPDEIEVTSG